MDTVVACRSFRKPFSLTSVVIDTSVECIFPYKPFSSAFKTSNVPASLVLPIHSFVAVVAILALAGTETTSRLALLAGTCSEYATSSNDSSLVNLLTMATSPFSWVIGALNQRAVTLVLDPLAAMSASNSSVGLIAICALVVISTLVIFAELIAWAIESFMFSAMNATRVLNPLTFILLLIFVGVCVLLVGV